MNDNRDSYTGEEFKAGYSSTIANIHVGRSPFYREAELLKIGAQYYTEPCPGGVRVRRQNYPATLFPVLPAVAQARSALDWCVLNDASVEIAIYWLNQKDVQPYLNLLQGYMEAANES